MVEKQDIGPDLFVIGGYNRIIADVWAKDADRRLTTTPYDLDGMDMLTIIREPDDDSLIASATATVGTSPFGGSVQHRATASFNPSDTAGATDGYKYYAVVRNNDPNIVPVVEGRVYFTKVALPPGTP